MLSCRALLLKYYNLQGNQRKNLESTVTQVEKEKMLLQHRISEYQRKAEQENEKRRNAENEGKLYFYFCLLE